MSKKKKSSTLPVEMISLDLGAENAYAEINSDGTIMIERAKLFDSVADLEDYIKQLQDIAKVAGNFPAWVQLVETKLADKNLPSA